MRYLLIALLAGALAGCGGGGGNSDTTPPPPPPVGQPLAITLAATGSFPAQFPSRAVSGFQLLNSLAEYDSFAAPAGPNVPLELRTLDFAQFSVMYVEGPADDFLGAVARLIEIRRFDGTRDEVKGERCTLDPAGIPTPSRAWRPYAFYVIPKPTTITSYSWQGGVVPGCETVSQVNFSLVAGGDWSVSNGRPQPPFGSRAIRTQADLNAVLPSFAPGSIPAQYLQPDFSQVTLLFVAANGDWDENSFVRVDRVYVNDDSSRDVVAEYCGNSGGGVALHGAFALYAVSRYPEATRFTIIEHAPGACFLSR